MTILRPTLSTYIFPGFVFLILGPLAVFLVIRDGAWDPLFVVSGMALTLVSWMSRYRISWDEEVLTYRSVIHTHKIRFSDVKGFTIRGPWPIDPKGPTVSLQVISEKTDDVVMKINIKPFSLGDIERLKERLNRAIEAKRTTA